MKKKTENKLKTELIYSQTTENYNSVKMNSIKMDKYFKSNSKQKSMLLKKSYKTLYIKAKNMQNANMLLKMIQIEAKQENDKIQSSIFLFGFFCMYNILYNKIPLLEKKLMKAFDLSTIFQSVTQIQFPEWVQ